MNGNNFTHVSIVHIPLFFAGGIVFNLACISPGEVIGGDVLTVLVVEMGVNEVDN